jgi:hypothetical protein
MIAKINTPNGVKEQFQFTLPPVAMDAIRAILADTTMSTQRRFEAVVVLVFGWSLWERQESVDPTMVAIPNDQWESICGWMTNLETDPIARVNYGLGWMNSGPTSFTREALVDLKSHDD